MASQTFIMLKKNGNRAAYAQIATLQDDVLIHYDIWPLDDDIEAINFAAPKFSIGAIYNARILKIDPKTNLVFLTLGTCQAVMKLKPKDNYLEGQYILAEIISDAFDDKSPRVRFAGDVKKSATTNLKPGLYREANNLAQYCFSLCTSLKLNNDHQVICDDFAFIAQLNNLAQTSYIQPNIANIEGNKLNQPSLFDHHNISERVAQLSEHKIKLSNGSNIIIDQLSAMTVIDVNSAEYIGNDSKKMVSDVNTVAANKIFEQLSLRQISGLVVIDFLKYSAKKDKLKFTTLLILLVKKYKLELGSYTMFGLVELKITRRSKSLANKKTEFQ